MLGYSPGVEVRFNALVALTSGTIAVLMASCGWLIYLGEDRRRLYGAGLMIGLALTAAHFIDMSALRVQAIVEYDGSLILLSILLGVPLCVAAMVMVRRQAASSNILTAALLTAGTMVLHLIAMSSVRLVPGPSSDFSSLDLGIESLTLIVIGTSTLVLLVGAALALHDLEIARVIAADREQLRQSEEHYRYSVELNPQIPWIADATGQILEISSRWGTVAGAPVSAALGRGWLEKVHPDDLASVRTAWKTTIDAGDDMLAEVRYRLQHADGDYQWYRATARPRRAPDGTILLWYGSLENIDKQVKAELALRRSEERYRLASKAANDVIWDLDAVTGIVEWSGATKDVLGSSNARFSTPREWWHDHIHPDDRGATLAQVAAWLSSGATSWAQEFRFRRADGQYLDMLSRSFVVRNDAGELVRIVGSLMDISARKRAENELRRAAHHDDLTDLPNRKLFALTLAASLRRARTTGARVGLMIIDVDRFKNLNDTLGHAAGDSGLIQVARRLSSSVPSGATVARLGGDEFAVIIPDLDADEDPGFWIASVPHELGHPIQCDGRQLEISVSVGWALYPRDGDDVASLMRSADLALYSAKADGAGLTRQFDPDMLIAAEVDNRMREDARQALRAGWIVPYYQPKVSLRSGAIIGFEALLRVQHPERGLQSPATIRSAFDDTRLAPELTDRMLARVTRDMANWLRNGLHFRRVALNGSPEDFRRGDLAQRILDRLADEGVPPTCFELEITESVFLSKCAEEVASTLSALRAAGVSIGLDDFGTGYASLTHLQQFPVDVPKIDQSFVSRLVSDRQQDAMIVGALIDLAKNLGIQTVAEGVETDLQAFMLRRRGCDAGQGYLFAHPLSAQEVEAFLDRWDPTQVQQLLGFGRR